MLRLGWHAGNEAEMTALDWEILGLVAPQVFVWLADYGVSHQRIGERELRRVLELCPEAEMFPRFYVPPSMAANDAELGRMWDAAAVGIEALLAFIPAARLHVQFFNEPNMPRWSQYEGFGDQLADMQRYDRVFAEGVERMRARFPGVHFGVMALTDGNRDMWFPGDAVGHYYMHGPTGCQEDLTAAQVQQAIIEGPCRVALLTGTELYNHTYIHRRDGQIESGELNYRLPWYGLRVERQAKFLPRAMGVWITEAGFPTRAKLDEAGGWAAASLVGWLDLLQARGAAAGVALWILGTHNGGMWYDGDKPRGEVYALRDWQRAQVTVPPAAGGALTAAEWAALMGYGEGFVIPMTPGHALWDAIVRDGLVLAGPEFARDGCACQWGYDAAANRRRLYAARVGDWGNVQRGPWRAN